MPVARPTTLSALVTFFAASVLTASPLVGQTHAVARPAGVPTSSCTFTPRAGTHDVHALRGTAPLTVVFSCHQGSTEGCDVDQFTPGSAALPADMPVHVDHVAGAWTCALVTGVPAWIASDRLMPYPATADLPTAVWVGTYHRLNQVGRKSTESLVLSAAAGTPGLIRVVGHAESGGGRFGPNLGDVDQKASAHGTLLHLTDGTDSFSCMLDLVADPASGVLRASDNNNCGGNGVSFSGPWKRVPSSSSKP